MPLPKDPNKIKEWKRKVGFKTMLSKKRSLEVVRNISEPIKILKVRKNMELSELSNKELLLLHAKLHVAFKDLPDGWNLWDIIKLHSATANKMADNNLKHLSYDELDEIYEYIEEESGGDE